MKAASLLALATLGVALPSQADARGGPRTLSDYNIQKEYLASPAVRAGAGRRHFHGMTSRFSTGERARPSVRARVR